MPRLHVRWASESDFKSFPEIVCEPGYYLDVLTGDIFRNAGAFTDASMQIIERHGHEPALNRKPFLLITDDLHKTLSEVKEMAAGRFGVSTHELGKLVHSVD
jgi:hypothetical protein